MTNQNKPAKQGNASPHLGSVSTTHIKGEIFQSNYPPPQMMEHYAQIDESFPRELLNMAKEEGKHRRWSEKFVIRGSFWLDLLGMIAALGGVGAILFVGWLFMKEGNAKEGAWIIGAVTVALAITFISRGKSKAKK